MIDAFKGYARFIYRAHEGGDLAPPHGVWDSAENNWAGGTFSSEEAARACAHGMNYARELFMQKDRCLTHLLDDLKRAVRSVESVTTTTV